MILPFNIMFPPKIDDGSKIHTMREDKKNRWRPGMVIHFATGVRTPKYNNWRTGKCFSLQEVEIIYAKPHNPSVMPTIKIDGRVLGAPEIFTLAKNDGFDTLDAFFNWFNKDWKGKIIHWTAFQYTDGTAIAVKQAKDTLSFIS